MPFFSKVFKGKDGASSKSRKLADQHNGQIDVAPKPRWEESWTRKQVSCEEVQELIHVCTQELKSRALDTPLLLLPFRPESDPSGAKSLIRNLFKSQYEGTPQFTGTSLQQELLLTEPMVLCSVMKWCWSRLPGGVVTWEAYELFKIGEQDSNMARHAFDTFIPLSVESDARKQIIFDFFDLLAAIAARGRTNGLGGRKLSRMAGWWAFEHSDNGKGFEGGYRSWQSAADASSHLFFAYLRSLSPDSVGGISGISTLPRSLQALLSQTEYPPEPPTLMQHSTTKVVMIVDSVSPTPFALLRRAKHFEYRDDDEALQEFSSYDDPISALTDECRRVLRAISTTNQSMQGLPDASWSQFADLGFSGFGDTVASTSNGRADFSQGLRSTPRSRTTDLGRPTTPSWADFLSSGFTDDRPNAGGAPLLLPPDKILPPIGEARVQSSQSHMRNGAQDNELGPGELASITQLDLDDTFWWVWMTSLASEEPTERKAVFGRCALIETNISGARWLVMEEQVKGATDGPEEGAYIAEKKGRFSFTRRGRLGRRKSTGKKVTKVEEPYNRSKTNTPMSKTSIGPDQHARIQAAAAQLALNQKTQESNDTPQRRGRFDDATSVKTNSVLTLQPHLINAATPAMQWAKEFDKDAIRAQYLSDPQAGKGMNSPSLNNLTAGANGTSAPSPRLPMNLSTRDLPALPKDMELEAPTASVSSPPPAPLPSTPTITASSKVAETIEAARVPLPATTPLDEKPITHDSERDIHPAYRQKTEERPPLVPTETNYAKDAARAAWESRPIEPESPHQKKSPPNKLKKTSGGGASGGFKKFFGMKKQEPAGRSSTPQPTEQVATVKAPQQTIGRRMSLLRKKPSPAPSPIEDEVLEPPTMPVVQAERSLQSSQPSPDMSAVSLQREDPRSALSRVDTDEQREADHAFSRFDQGPLDDVPAFVPDDSDSSRPPTPHQKYDVSAPTEPETPGPVHHLRVEQHPADDVSEVSVDLSRQISPQDRWAQIRKNAAERAARVSEEQSRRSQSQSARTDDGETSGEETIESRVARIKARVAELTGNMDPQGNIPPSARR
ncbi:DUF1708-domain-containing protein [Patellaria atrata CBS 101060]|uniref:DUF1708-domain-containing protein n=1 Tax=Patellaria atrata CBS 101060 TaxID=1346257 RepID=A0A9P4VP84_9PEZI|nr:DUF1708-domain-containing protein [Patellaria atrata CBS 101060]